MKRLALLLSLLFLAAVSGPVHASLVGDNIQGSLTFTSFNIGNCFDPNNPKAISHCNADFTDTSGIQPLAIVSEDDSQYTEFLYSDTGPAGDFLDVVVDVDAYHVRIEIIDRSSIPPEDALTPWGWTIALTDLDWNPQGNLIGADVTSYKQPGGDEFQTIDPFVAAFGPDSLSINFIGRESNDSTLENAWKDYGHLVAEIDLQTDQVPIPGAVWMLGSGLIGLVALGRKYRK
jgi:hypothetical protein